MSCTRWPMTEFSRVLHSGSWKMFPRQCVTFITGITLSHSCVVLPPSRVSHSLAALQPRFYMIIRAEVLISVPISSVWFYEILQPCDSRAWVFLLKEWNSPWLKLLICPLTRATAVSWLDQRCPPVLSWTLHAHLFGLLLYVSMKYSPLVSSTSPCGKRLTVYLLYWGDSTSKEALFVFISTKRIWDHQDCLLICWSRSGMGYSCKGIFAEIRLRSLHECPFPQ